ncbi:MAG: imidazole glycerol phosphate synthase subunit HisH [Elusimicrobia bacterium]|nr:imidazole glycerol phosphate synthase subunit HisH [Elusimicrobiota bacterium]
MSLNRVVIVDYGLGNLFSVVRALHQLGAEGRISGNPQEIVSAERLILPGVGAFGDGMAHLNERGLVPALHQYAASGRPLLGICLGMQILMSTSEEFGFHRGLDLIKGKVILLERPREDRRFKVPHIGWNALYRPQDSGPNGSGWRSSLLDHVAEGSCVYFLHSYAVVPDSQDTCAAVTRYANNLFCSVIKQGNVQGVQFHPERSGEAGLSLLRNFINDNSRPRPLTDGSVVAGFGLIKEDQ